MGKRSYNIGNDEIIQQASKDINVPAAKIDESVQAYEKAIVTLVNEVIEKDKDFDEINVFSRISGAIIEPDEGGIAITPIYPKDLFEEMNSKYAINTQSESSEEVTEAKAS